MSAHWRGRGKRGGRAEGLYDITHGCGEEEHPSFRRRLGKKKKGGGVERATCDYAALGENKEVGAFYCDQPGRGGGNKKRVGKKTFLFNA